ncbi:MAG: histidine kinase [Nakamurella sp.]
MTTWVVLGYLLIQLIASMSLQVDDSLELIRRIAAIGLGVFAVLGFLRLQALVLIGEHRVPAWLRWSLTAVGLVLLALSDAWAMLGVSLAVVLLTGTLVQVLVFGFVMTGLAVVILVWHESAAVAVIGIPMICWLAAGVIAVLTRIAVRTEGLRVAREQLARQSIDEERHRISRELHDILGRTLVAVSVRTQTALRLIDRDVDACRGQLEQIAAATADGQAQLRRLIQGEVIVGLDTELENATDLFDRLGVHCELDTTPVCAEAVEVLAAQVLRESVTNMLKHSRPRHAWISVRDEGLATVVTAINDGSPADNSTSSGTGLAELADQVRAAGGTLEAGSVEHGRFRVIARIPHVHQRQETLT